MERHRSSAKHTLTLSADPQPATELVSLLVPVLNDGFRAARLATALLRQLRVPKLDIVFLDAGSSDLTRVLLHEAVEEDQRVRILTGAPPPAGWCVHAHACEQLAVAARGRSLVFADPGLALAPGAVAAAVAGLRGGGYDLLLAEAHRRTRPVAGQEAAHTALLRQTCARLLAVDREAYWRAGGHCAAAHDPFGETGLLQAVRRTGGRVATADGRHAIEFLDGSMWPRVRAGAPLTCPERYDRNTGQLLGARGRGPGTDTENSLLHSFTDTARRLLASLALTSPAGMPAGMPARASRPQRPVRAAVGPEPAGEASPRKPVAPASFR